MDKTFIKTSQGIIRTGSIVFIGILGDDRTKETTIRVYFSSAQSIWLRGKEAQSFLQIIPIAIDFSKLNKEESGVEIAGLRM
jgi:hypothetical protein